MKKKVTGERPTQQAGAAGGALFWCLISLALAVLTPCVILPEWKQLEALSVAAQAAEHRTSALQKNLERQMRLFEAMRSDPAVVARLAQRDLSLYRRDERAIFVSIPQDRMLPEEPFTPKLLEPPPLVAKLTAHLPNYDFIGLFCENRTRLPLLAMSAALAGVAFALFGRRLT